MESFLQDVRYAFRQMARTPVFTALLVLVLALGMAMTSAALSYTRSLRTLPAPGVAPNERLVSVAILDRGGRGDQVTPISFANFIRLRRTAIPFSTLAAERVARSTVDAGSGPQATYISNVTAEYFQTLELKPELGQFFPGVRDELTPAPLIAVISYKLWRTAFGSSPGVIGRPVNIGGTAYTIVGVAPNMFNGMDGEPMSNVWTPLTADIATTGGDSLQVTRIFGRLADGIAPDAARSVLGTAAALALRGETGPERSISAWVERARISVTGPRGADGDSVFAAFVLGLVAFVMTAITCTNVSALLLGRSAARRLEVAVRFSLGADRRRVIRQLLTESVLLALLSTAVGMLLLVWMRDAIHAVNGGDPPIVLTLDWQTWVLAFGAALATGVVFGLSPALHATRTSISETMKLGGSPSDWRRTRAQRAMIVTQLAVSQPVLLFLALALGLVGAQRPWDFSIDSPEHVIGLGLDFGARRYQPADAQAIVAQLRDRLATTPGVERVEIADRVPALFRAASGGYSMIPLQPEELDPSRPRSASPSRSDVSEIARVGLDYFATVGLPIVRGRGFVAADSAPGVNSVVIPENVAAAFWPGRDPIGKRLVSGSMLMPGGGTATGARGIQSSYTVVGVARSHRSMLPDARPLVYLPGGMSPHRGTTFIIRVRGPAAGLFATIQREVRRLDPQLPIAELKTAEQAEQASLGIATRIAGAATFCAFLALGLVSLGLAGIVMFAVTDRTREIGVRIALGARASQVVRMFVGQGFRTAAIGLACGIPLSILVFVGTYKVFFASSVGLNTGAALVSIVVLFTVVGLAAWLPARRAASIDAVIALRSE